MRLYHIFIRLAASVLTVTCLAKLVSVFGSAEVLKLPEALFGWPTRWVMVLAALTEAVVVGILLSKAEPLTKLGTILWLSVNFATYRVCLWTMGVSATCPCMGKAYGLIGISSATMDRVMGWIVLVLLAGSAYFIYRFSGRRTPVVAYGEPIPATSAGGSA